MSETIASNLLQNIIVFGVLGGLFVLGYCRFKQKTLLELFQEVMAMFKGTGNE